MVLDTSAIVAILQGEPDAFRLALAIEADRSRLVSAATVLEAGIVATARGGEEGGRDLDAFLTEAEVEIVPVTAAHVRLAREGFLRFGRGRHPARLDLGDLFSYALAKASGQPVLHTGNDFNQTDVAVVRLPPAR